MLKVSEILRVKGNTLYTATPDTPIQAAIDTMSEQDIGSLVIMDHGQLAGMLTFREIIRYLHRAKGNVGDYTVRSIMDDAPVSVSPNTGFEEVQRLMLEKHARYIPVMTADPAWRDFVLRHGRRHRCRPGVRKHHAQGVHSRLAGRQPDFRLAFHACSCTAGGASAAHARSSTLGSFAVSCLASDNVWRQRRAPGRPLCPPSMPLITMRNGTPA